MPTQTSPANVKTADFDAVIIGAGFSGLYLLHRLRNEMGLSVRGYEAGSDIGGTWYWNRYPGARTDSLSSIYRFTFSPELAEKWSFSERYPTQAEMLEYINFVADRFDLRRDFRFNSRVTESYFDDENNHWVVSTDGGDKVTATYLVSGTGLMSAPNVPVFKNLNSFAGKVYHTAQWPHDGVDFSGKRVGLIGTGSTGVQILPHLAEQADSVTVFQRTPNYVIPAQNRPLTAEEQEHIRSNHEKIATRIRQHFACMPFDSKGMNAFDVDDETRLEIYEEAWENGGFHFLFGTFDDLLVDQVANETACEFIRGKIREIVQDPEVAEALIPYGYPYGAKRPPAGTNYYETYNKDNVRLVNVRKDPIVEFTPTGLRTEADQFEFDTLVFATGFDVGSGALLRMDIRGRGGVKLAEKWQNGPVTNLGLITSDFPNLFLIAGPHTPFANFPTVIEEMVDWTTDCIAYMRQNGYTTIEPTQAAEQQWTQHVGEVVDMTIAANGEAVNTWFTGANIEGKPHAAMLYFGGANNYFDMLHRATESKYEGFALK
ncbi:Baeyer-Villiger monooxygenase (plasmid) [Rhodococcus ruber]|uniref:flavin-containing monooxygenase n=1 Tax=Rhodococcus ruber TaxID=1830 RepID=UPI00315C4C92